MVISKGKTETTAGSANRPCKGSIWGRIAAGSSGGGGLLLLAWLTWAKKAVTLPTFSLFSSFRCDFLIMMTILDWIHENCYELATDKA